MRFTKILLVCLGVAVFAGESTNQASAIAKSAKSTVNPLAWVDGPEPLPRPPLVADGPEPLPRPPLVADGPEPLPRPPLVADGPEPLPRPPAILAA
jgi:hypothetical protein